MNPAILRAMLASNLTPSQIRTLEMLLDKHAKEMEGWARAFPEEPIHMLEVQDAYQLQIVLTETKAIHANETFLSSIDARTQDGGK